MDWVNGELLIYRVKDNPQIEKEILFDWMRQLLDQLQKYHQCHKNQNYRYLNPYSVLIARDGKLLLLDLEAESNEFVLRNLQKRAMRTHFVKPIVHISESSGDALDLYGYGKTMQFILANTKVEPSLTRNQENKLEKIINKCLNENPGKQYKGLKQVEKELPVIRNKQLWEEKKHLVFSATAIASITACVGCCILFYNVMQQQKNLKIWVSELQRMQNEESTAVKAEDVEVLVESLESKLREEIGYTEESIADVNSLLEQHIEETKSIEEAETTQENVEETEETEENITEESENEIQE